MKVFALWYGGSNYSVPYIEDREKFDSMTAAKKEFSDRRFNIKKMTPNVNQNSEMHIFFSDPTDSTHPYPDRLIKFGTRGGLVVESC